MGDQIIIYTDGGVINNGKKKSWCGWAYKKIYGELVTTKSGGDVGKTNNQMEMTAVLKALQSVIDKTVPVRVYSDSMYVVETLNGTYSIHKNVDLWKTLKKEARKFRDIKFIWVKGHEKNVHNNEVDELVRVESNVIKRCCIGLTNNENQ